MSASAQRFVILVGSRYDLNGVVPHHAQPLIFSHDVRLTPFAVVIGTAWIIVIVWTFGINIKRISDVKHPSSAAAANLVHSVCDLVGHARKALTTLT